ncbi:MAG: 2-C-methyl-D-erythritol 4-phosphate cytidylyltransferase [Tepidisphaeraceae bacterium]
MSTAVKFAAILFTAAPDSSSSPAGAFVKVDGRESLLRGIELFVNRENFGPIIVTVSPTDADQFKNKFASHLMILGIKAATATGATLKDHLQAGIAKLPTEVTHVIVHDGARPAVSALDIDALLELAPKHDAVAMVSTINAPMVEIEAGQLMNHRAAKRSAACLRRWCSRGRRSTNSRARGWSRCCRASCRWNRVR